MLLVYTLTLQIPVIPFIWALTMHRHQIQTLYVHDLIYLLIFNWSGYSCFTMLCLCCTTKWISYVYTYIPSVWNLSHIPPSHPSRPSYSIKRSFLCWFLLSLYLTHGSTYMSIPSSQFTPLSFPTPTPAPCPHVCSWCLSLYSCPANRFICTIFLDSTYKH